jgi:tetratricopeptide (TPR) repeat protein
LGEIYASDGRSDRAIEAFEKVMVLAPHWPQGFFTLARHYEAEERDAEALRTYSQGLALEPSNPQARNNYEKLAIKMALGQGKPVELTLGTDQKVQIDPESANSYYQLGLRYLRNDEAEAAVVALQQAIAIQPGSDVAQLFLGLAYTSLGAHSKAESAYRRAIALRPTNPHAYNYLGLTYHQQQRYREALTAYHQAIAQNPAYAVAYVNLAASHEALGQTAQALTAYRQALQYDTNLQAVQTKIDALSKQLEK